MGMLLWFCYGKGRGNDNWFDNSNKGGDVKDDVNNGDDNTFAMGMVIETRMVAMII